MKRVLFFVLFLLPSAVHADFFSRTQVLMGDVPVTLTIQAKPSLRDKAFTAMETAFDEARRLENSISEWRASSQTTRLNQNAGKALVPVDREMMGLLLAARRISEMTDGAFDITFASKNKKISYRDVVLIPELGLAYLRPGVKIGVSGIAKGTIVDRMTAILRRSGFKNFLVNAGDLYAAGRWPIGIRDPDQPGKERSVAELDVKDLAVSTSGLYERGAHIIDPKTGRPPLGLKSATVVARTSQEADALATAFFVLGEERSAKVLQGLRNVSGVFVDGEGKLKTHLAEEKLPLRVFARP